MAKPRPIDKGEIIRRCTDWQLGLPFDVAQSLGPVEMGSLVTLVESLVFVAVRDEARACAERAVNVWVKGLQPLLAPDVYEQQAEAARTEVRGFTEEPSE